MSNVFYEEDGAFKVAAILADNDTSLQVEAPHGKRSKIKSAAVVLKFEQPPSSQFMVQAQGEAAALDVDFLWQCCGPNEFVFTELGKEYYGHAPNPVESAALLLRLHGAPMYFYKKGKGRYKAAPQDALKAALAGVERKRKQDEIKSRYLAQLGAGELPEEFRPLLMQLLYDPDKNSLEYKALDAACSAAKLSPGKLLARCGALASAHDYHLNRFLHEHFAGGTGFADFAPPGDLPELPVAEAVAFSIDDSTTTEIDDAFSVTPLDGGQLRIGIHIAAPALGIAPGSDIDRLARERLSTVYLPGDKITMLPDSVIERFTLAADRANPALSLYLTVAPPDLQILATHTRVERIKIAANLRHDDLETRFNEQAIRDGLSDFPFAQALTTLWKLASKLESARGAQETGVTRLDYNFYIEQGRVRIVPRVRGTPIDKIVSELMIYANASWGKEMAERTIPAIYRTQGNGKVQMSVEPAPHEGLGVPQYAWASSPLRRYVDLVNQRQIVAWASGTTPAYARGSDELASAMRDFEIAYETYAEFQRNMERYWCLMYLQQHAIKQISAHVLRESLVRLVGLPLVCRVPSLPNLAPGSEVQIEVVDVDPWELSVNCVFKHKGSA